MKANRKKQDMVLFNNYEGYEFEQIKKDILECNGLDEISDQCVWNTISDYEKEDYEEAISLLKKAFGDNKVIVSGTIGRWDGHYSGGNIFQSIEKAIDECVKDCGYIKITQMPDKLIYVECSHHDGTNVFYIKVLTERGWVLYDNWNYGIGKYAGCKGYDVLDKIWNDTHYSRRCGRIEW